MPSDHDDSLPDEIFEIIAKAWENVQEKFKQKTGIDLFLKYHNPDDGDRYDEVSEAFFCLDMREIFEYSEKAKKLLEQGILLEKRSFVEFC